MADNSAYFSSSQLRGIASEGLELADGHAPANPPPAPYRAPVAIMTPQNPTATLSHRTPPPSPNKTHNRGKAPQQIGNETDNNSIRTPTIVQTNSDGHRHVLLNEANGISISEQPTLRSPASDLPCLLRYIDHHIAGASRLLDHSTYSSCSICSLDGSHTPLLSLPPCFHLVHFNCFISYTSRAGSGQDKCPVCATPLFHYDGINASTLATRFDVQLENGKITPYMDQDANKVIRDDKMQYEADCVFIMDSIAWFFECEVCLRCDQPFPEAPLLTEKQVMDLLAFRRMEQLFGKKPYLNLLNAYSAVLKHMEETGRPRSRWLSYETEMGKMLWETLILIKFQRWLEENAPVVTGKDSQGWVDLEDRHRQLAKDMFRMNRK